jgi:hypothetical protein
MLLFGRHGLSRRLVLGFQPGQCGFFFDVPEALARDIGSDHFYLMALESELTAERILGLLDAPGLFFRTSFQRRNDNNSLRLKVRRARHAGGRRVVDGSF